MTEANLLLICETAIRIAEILASGFVIGKTVEGILRE
jgi:hypothetical protein